MIELQNIFLHLNILITSNTVIHLLLIWQECPKSFQALHIIISVSKTYVMSLRKLCSCKTMGNNTLETKRNITFHQIITALQETRYIEKKVSL